MQGGLQNISSKKSSKCIKLFVCNKKKQGNIFTSYRKWLVKVTKQSNMAVQMLQKITGVKDTSTTVFTINKYTW